jgi:hypothetical protein
MLKSEDDGQIRRAQTALRVEGAAIEQLVANPGFAQLIVREESGRDYTVSAEDATNAVVTQMWDQVVLVLPARGRGLWVQDVVEITSHE